LKDSKNLIDTLFNLHKQRWEIVRNESSSFYNEYRKKFNNTFINRCEKNDVLFSLVKINNEIASIMYMFIYKNNIFYYQNGWLPKYSKLSIGLFHIYKVIEYSIKKKYHSFDLLRGDENYKLKLKGENRKTFTVLYFKTSFKGTIIRLLFIIIQNLKLAIKKIYSFKGSNIYL
jgi:CelD/BcsL family acetyltransferase involved in cellulose biosynthesis